MIVKLFELRDRFTFMPVMAIKLNPETEQERFLLAKAGYGVGYSDQSKYIILLRINGDHVRGSSDCYDHFEGRTMGEAHKYIYKNWSELKSGDLIDVEFILGETNQKKSSENETLENLQIAIDQTFSELGE